MVIHAVRDGLELIGEGRRSRWVLLVVVAVLTGGLEIVGAAMVYLLLALVTNPTGPVDLPLVGDLRAWTDLDQEALLLSVAVVMAVLFLLRAVARVGQANLQSRVGQEAGARLSRELVFGYLSMPYAFHLRRRSPELIRNAHTAVDELVGFVFLPVVTIAAEVITVVAMLVLLSSVAPLATVLAVLVVGSTGLVLLRMVQPRLQQLGWTSHDLNRATLGSLQQSLEGARDIKLLGRERTFADAYGQWRDELSRTRRRYATIAALPRSVIELSLMGLVLVLFVVGITGEDQAEGLLSVVGLFAYAGLRLQPSLQRIVSSLNNLRFADAPLQDLRDDHRMVVAHRSRIDEDAQPIPFEHEWRAADVAFAYDEDGPWALRDVDVRIRPGEAIGVCGPTGGGKTTLVDVLTGLLPPSRGRVTVDDADLRDHARGWQCTLGVVPQDVFLIDDTIRYNIALGIAHEEIDQEAVDEAVHLAQLDEFVAGLPDGLDTVVGERGVRLSGGQRQRVAIARALYRRPRVLVFDEGTAALDNTTEAAVLGALERLRGTHTILMVAHRLSTVRNCDRIVHVEGGRIAGQDTFEALVANSPSFRRLATQQ